MAEEESIFAKKSSAKSAEKSIFEKSNKTKPTGKPKTGLIVAIIAIALAVVGGIIALVLFLVLNQPDYEKMATAIKSVEKSGLDSDLSSTNFSYLPNGRFSKTTHDRYVKSAKDDLSKLRDHLKVVKDAITDLEKAGAAKSDVSKEYEDFKSQADELLPKLEKAVGDMDKYIDFSDRYYNSKLVVLDSYSSDYSSVKDMSDSDIDKIFQPLMEASSDKLREFGEGMAKYIKAVVKFYSKYYDYLHGNKVPSDDVKSELNKDSDEIKDMTKEIEDFSDISEDDIFDFTQRDLNKFTEATENLSDAVKKLL